MTDTARGSAMAKAKRFRFTVGFSKSQAVWGNEASMTFNELADKFSKCKTSDNKDGACVVPAIFSGKKRQAKDVVEIAVLFLDSDSGHTLKDIRDTVTGYSAVVHSTYSHMSNTSEVSRKKWVVWQDDNILGSAEEFLIATKGFLPHIAKDAEVTSIRGDNVVFKHQPCPKYRIIIPLKQPFEAKEFDTHVEFKQQWRARVKTLVNDWGLSLDQTCFETARLFFDPRRPEGSPRFESYIIRGAELLDLYQVEPDVEAVATATRSSEFKGEAKYIDFDVAKWYRENARRFDIKALIDDKVPELLTSRISEDRYHILCPFRDEHTKLSDDPASEGDAFIRPARGDGLGFAVYCSHNSCQKRHTVDFLHGMLNNDWFSTSDLESATYRPRIKDFGVLTDEDLEDVPDNKETPLELVDLTGWESEPEPREWVLDEWIPRGYVTGLYGPGGSGKSLLAQQLMTCLATGISFLGLEVKKMKVLGIFCEDDARELHRRQHAINNSLFVDYKDLADFNVVSRLGDDNLIMLFSRNNRGKRTPFWQQILDTGKRVGADLIIIDTLADVFAGNENERPQVRQFVQAALARLAQELNCAVLICAHPAKVGDSGYSGSTAWDATLRSRLYLERRDDTELASNYRYLSKKKSNYSTIDDEIKMEYVAGCFKMKHRIDSIEIEPGASREDMVKAIAVQLWLFIRRRNEQRQCLSHNKRTSNYYVKETMRDSRFRGIKVAIIETAFQLLVEGEYVSIDQVIYERANRHPALGIKTEKEPTVEAFANLDEEDELDD